MKKMTLARGFGASACVAALGLFVGGCAVEAGSDSTGSESAGQELAPPGNFRSGAEGDETTQKTCTVSRPDVWTTVQIGSGSYGNWNCWDYCAGGSFAYAVSQRSESPRGSGDDTALNAVRLDCYYKNSSAYAGYVTSGQNGWGSWHSASFSSPFTISNPFIGGRMRIEPGQGSNDDTMANQVALTAANFVETVPAAATGWGVWNSTNYCPSGTAVCGISTRTEPSQGSGDDTALNGVRLACCPF